MDEVTVGRIVHYVMPDMQHRPAIVVRVWGPTCVNLQVITDGSNDGQQFAHGHVWRTSVLHDEDTKAVNTWHWPERTQPAQQDASVHPI